MAAGAALGMCLAAPSVRAKWMRGEPVPVARLLKNVGAYIKAHPKDAQGYYTQGRLHSLALANLADNSGTPAPESETVPVYGSGGAPASGSAKALPGLPGYLSVTPGRNFIGSTVKSLSPSARTHLRESIRAYERAVALAPKEALYQLGLGFMYEQATRFPGSLGGTMDNDADKRALLHYRRAYEAKRTEELGQQGFGPGGDIVSLEAGEGILRILARHKPTAAEQKEIASVRADVTTLQAKPRAITPILVGFDAGASLPDLLKPESRVRFDLAGDGRKQVWPWVKPTTGILVWDPNRTGKVASGRQCFGSVTWWMFWRDGYAPLAALDDNGDGILRGRELDGLAVWFDRNGNGVSDPGEVVPVRALGIVGIAARADGTDHDVPCNRQGVWLRNGTTAATFDWTPEPLAASARLSTR